MGDRYEITIKCAGCGTSNEHWHSESSGAESFVCICCKEINRVSLEFVASLVTIKEAEKKQEIKGRVKNV